MTNPALKSLGWIAASHSAAQAGKLMPEQGKQKLHMALSAAFEAIPALLEAIEDPKHVIPSVKLAELAEVLAFKPERDALVLPTLLPMYAAGMAAYAQLAPRNAHPAEWETPLYWQLMQQQSMLFAQAFQLGKTTGRVYLEVSKVYRDMAATVMSARLPNAKAKSADRFKWMQRAQKRADELEKSLVGGLLEDLRGYSDEVAFFIAALG